MKGRICADFDVVAIQMGIQWMVSMAIRCIMAEKSRTRRRVQITNMILIAFDAHREVLSGKHLAKGYTELVFELALYIDYSFEAMQQPIPINCSRL